MMLLVNGAFWVLAFLLLQVEGAPRGPLIWSEEFDSLNVNTWTHLITGWRGGNNEFQYYTNRSENSFTRDGVLYIKPTLTADRFGEDFLYNGVLDLNQEGCNIDYDGGCVIRSGEEIINPLQSARMITKNSFDFTYGTVEVRAKMPRGDWIWPAIWMLPTDDAYGGWPKSGEIDIVEIRGNDNFTCGDKHLGNKLMGSTLHWGPDPGQNAFDKTHWEKYGRTAQLFIGSHVIFNLAIFRLLQDSDFAADFHIYGLEWLASGFKFYVDGELIGSVSPPAGGFWELGGFSGNNLWQDGTPMAPFDQKFHFVLNVAVGGNFFPEGCSSKPWSSSGFPQMRPFWEQRDTWLPTWNANTDQNSMQVDYIRVYSL